MTTDNTTNPSARSFTLEELCTLTALEIVLGIRVPDGIRAARAPAFQLASTWRRHAWPASAWLGSESVSAVAWIALVTEEEAWMGLDRLEFTSAVR